jgi:tellurite resistance protein TehA-like permease
MVLTGGILVAAAVILWMVLDRRNRAGDVSRPGRSYPRPPLKTAAAGPRWQLAGCVALATVGLDIAAVHGIGAPSPAQSGITAELGFAMMLLAVVWFLFRDEVVRFQLSAATAVFGLPTPIDSGQVRAAEKVGAFVRVLLFLLGLFTVLVKLVLR